MLLLLVVVLLLLSLARLLFQGFDLTNSSLLEAAWPIIANEEVLAVSQVWAGHPGRLVANSTEYKVVNCTHGSPGTVRAST